MISRVSVHSLGSSSAGFPWARSCSWFSWVQDDLTMCQAHVAAGCRLRDLSDAAHDLSSSETLDWLSYVTVSGQRSKRVKRKLQGFLRPQVWN